MIKAWRKKDQKRDRIDQDYKIRVAIASCKAVRHSAHTFAPNQKLDDQLVTFLICIFYCLIQVLPHWYMIIIWPFVMTKFIKQQH